METETLNRLLEPGAQDKYLLNDTKIQLSIAISLKRLADVVISSLNKTGKV